MLPGLAIVMLQSDLVSGLSVSAFPTSVAKSQGFGDGASHALTTPTTTATASGGTGPYTYAWALLSGSGITATSAATAATAFTATLGPEETRAAIFRVTATDTATLGKATADVSVSLHYVDLR